MTLSELFKEIDIQKIDFIQICQSLELDPGELGKFSIEASPFLSIGIGMALGVLYERKMRREKSETIH